MRQIFIYMNFSVSFIQTHYNQPNLFQGDFKLYENNVNAFFFN
jgi:hypothetical protein